ncbi:MAG: hypothetical protein Barrevirus1_13 [Barrevirus sp.]|uniref:Endonuclease/exonuclease/phosphatase domain-containing protein n=1 Tax=Barrevirus sp. TaxID=2487763 RepID=A0A3G4ZS11_9VIRU|nr:MAG: hypothetical protein Barrevirus1_13 [Barrevirus sp.]
MKFVVAAGLAIGVSGMAYSLLKKSDKSLVIGAFNMQYGPYKISRIDKDTTGLDPIKKEKILTFNKYCMSKVAEDAQLDQIQAGLKIFGNKDIDNDFYEMELINCLRWKQDKNGKFIVDVAETFKTFFDPVNHQLWTSAIIDTTEEVSNDIRSYGTDIMALVETSAGIKNALGQTIPHTDNLTKLIENLNKDQVLKQVDYRIASYAQFTNPASESFAQLDRGNAIIYNAVNINLINSFTIEISAEKRGKVTTRRYPVCLFGPGTEPTIMVCAAHITGYSYQDTKKGGNPDNITIGDRELENVLRILSQDFTETKDPKEITIDLNGHSYQLIDMNYSKVMKDMGVTKDLPIIVLGDFNQDFNKYTFEYPHEYRFPTFVPHEGTTVASRYGFQNGYTLAQKIYQTTDFNATIDGFLIKNIKNVSLLSKPFDQNNATSDHSAIYVKV